MKLDFLEESKKGLILEYNNSYKLSLAIIFMGYPLWFGKYNGSTLEEVALGKKCPGGKSEGYYYFDQLVKGDPKYFGMFQKSSSAMQRWTEISQKVNNFKVVQPYTNCPVCKEKLATNVCIAGNSQYGYSLGPEYRCCDSAQCKDSLTSMPSSGAGIYPIAFETMLNFCWSSGNRKCDQERVAELMKTLAGWTGRINDKKATEFIDNLEIR